MKVALLRIREARERLRISQASLLPSADASAGWSLSPDRGFRSSTSQDFTLGASTSWELDLFGGNRRSIEAYRASLIIHRKLPPALSAPPCWRTWLRPTSTGSPPANNSASPGNNWKSSAAPSPLRKKRHTAGFAPRLDVEQATSSVAATESHIPALIAQVASAKNQLSVLLGTYNSRMELTMPKATVFEKTPVVPVGLPSELLRRRPDVIAAGSGSAHSRGQRRRRRGRPIPALQPDGFRIRPRQRLRPALPGKQQCVVSGRQLGTAPVPGGALRANVRAQQAAAEQAAETYRKTLITAVSEVEEALIDYGNYTSQMPYLQKENKANKGSVQDFHGILPGR